MERKRERCTYMTHREKRRTKEMYRRYKREKFYFKRLREQVQISF